MTAIRKALKSRRALALLSVSALLTTIVVLTAVQSPATAATAKAVAPCEPVCQVPPLSLGTLYVDWEAPGANTGTSWYDAYTGLQLALTAAQPGDEIWVAAGTYYPSVEHGGTGDRFRSFQMLNQVAIYGGFDPTTGDTGWDDRDWVTNETILSGDIGVLRDSADNCYHVFYHPDGLGLDSSAILDGFVITDGNADGGGDHSSGGGMFNNDSSPALANCTFSGNVAAFDGGGISCVDGSSPTLTSCRFEGNAADWGTGGGMSIKNASPVLSDCTFTLNSAGWDGGAVYTEHSAATFEHCTFTLNQSLGYGGGVCTYASSPSFSNCMFTSNVTEYSGAGMAAIEASPVLSDCAFLDNQAQEPLFEDAEGGGLHSINSLPILTNCTFAGNSADTYGGAIANSGVSLTATNCSFYGNTATYGGGAVYNSIDALSELTNCILWADSPNELDGDPHTLTYSDIQGGYVGGDGNIDQDPFWLDPGSGDFHLTGDSPCIDAGNNDTPGLPPHDFEGDERIIDGDGDGTATVDMGIDEATEPEPITGLVAVNDSPTELGGTTSLTATIETGDPASFVWAFGDGEYGSGDVADHTYPVVGFYTAVVTASNSLGESSTTTPVTVTGVPISGLQAMNDSPTELGSATTMSASITAGSDVTYTWAFGDGQSGTEADVIHIYPDVGTYTAVVTASNSLGELAATTAVTITDVPISGLQAMNDSPTPLGSATALTATIAAGSNVSYTWAFGDGEFDAGPEVTHVYAAAGAYTAIVTATNGVSLVEATTQVEVYQPYTHLYLPLVRRD